MMFAVATVGILLAMAMALVRALMGPTVYDRVLAVNTFGTKTVLFIGVTGFLTERPEWLDLAIVYALINFVGTLAVLRFAKYGQLTTDDQAKLSPSSLAKPSADKRPE